MAPCRLSCAAQAHSVARVVATSSTSRMDRPFAAEEARKAPRRLACRSAALSCVCERVCRVRRIRSVRTGRPAHRSDSASASSSLWL